METTVLCECDSWDHCGKSIKLDQNLYLEIVRRNGVVVIVDGCKNGPNNSDTFIEQRDGYALYQE